MRRGTVRTRAAPFCATRGRNALRVDRERRAAVTARATTDRRIERLTKREREILELIAAGHQNREIATQLGISARTVEVHKARIMEKLECRSLAELMRANRALS